MLENLQRINIDIIHSFLESRDVKTSGIPTALAEYILQINEAYNLNKKYRSIGECAKHLRIKYPVLSLPTCKSRIYDAIEFFNADCSVTAPAWNSYYADQMMKLADVCLVAHQFSEARRCFEKAREYNLAASENRVDPKRTQFKHQIVSADMQLKRMGISPKGILNAYEEAVLIIRNRDISAAEQKRLITEVGRELNVEDISHEDV